MRQHSCHTISSRHPVGWGGFQFQPETEVGVLTRTQDCLLVSSWQLLGLPVKVLNLVHGRLVKPMDSF